MNFGWILDEFRMNFGWSLDGFWMDVCNCFQPTAGRFSPLGRAVTPALRAQYGAPRRGATAVLGSVKMGLVRPGSAIMALWGGHAHSAGPNLLASIFPPFFGFVFGMPFFRPFWCFSWISAPILAPFWSIFHDFCIPFSSLDFA